MGSLRKRTRKDAAGQRWETGWEARWYGPDNRQHAKTFKSKTAASRHITIMEAAKEQGDYIDHRQARTPFGELAEAWFANLPSDRKPLTLAGYRGILDHHLRPALYDTPIGKVTPGVIADFINGLGVQPGTKRNVLRVISPIMNRAVQHEMIRTNPATQVRVPKGNRTAPVFLDAAEVGELAAALGPPYDTLALFAAYTGLRAGESAGLRVKRLDLLHGRVTVAESVTDVNGHLYFGRPKNGRTRTVGLPKFLVERLTAQIAGKGPEDFVFSAVPGNPMRHGNFYARHFKPAVAWLVASGAWPEDKRGLRYHDLRHTAASLLIAQNVHPKAVSEWLGHSGIGITMDRYGHLYEGHEELIVAGLEETFRQAAVAKTPTGAVEPMRVERV